MTPIEIKQVHVISTNKEKKKKTLEPICYKTCITGEQSWSEVVQLKNENRKKRKKTHFRDQHL